MSTDPEALRGWFGPADRGWFDFLRAMPNLDEVNFWVPSGKLPFKRVVPIGAPFFFKLKSPYNAIGGFGYYAHGSVLPLHLAWDAFEEKNGAPDYDSLYQLIAPYRKDVDRSTFHPKIDIGCLMISSPVFFEDDQFIPQPRNWPSAAVQGTSIDLTEGEGLRVWSECQLRVAGRPAGSRVSDAAMENPGERFGARIQVTPRLGQGTFRVALLDAYGRRCAVTTEHSLPVLDAAHIRPYSKGGPHSLSNGLVLRTDIHRLYDLGYVGVDPRGRFQVSSRLRGDWENGKVYYENQGRELVLPKRDAWRPDAKALEWHMDEVFLG